MVRLLVVVEGGPTRERLSEPRREEDESHHDEEGVRIQGEAPVLDLRPAGRIRRGVGPDSLFLVRLATDVLGRLRFVRALLDQPDGGEREGPELQPLGLPVLEHVGTEVRAPEITEKRDGLLAVLLLVLVELVEPRDRLTDEADEEQAEKEEREAVLAEEPPHAQRCASPMIE